MAGLLPLSHVEIAEWSRLMKIEPTPLEVHALVMLDAVIRNPERVEEAEEEAPVTHAWPEKKHG